MEILFFISLLFSLGFIIYDSMIILLYQPKSQSKSNTELLSVVICAHNEEKNLEGVLNAILNQNYLYFECILVLDRCTDKSVEIAESFDHEKLKTLNIQSVPKNFNSKKYAITNGIEMAKGKWIVHTDADCIPEKNWLKNVSKYIDPETNFILGYSPYFKVNGWLNKYIRYETFSTARNFMASSIAKKPYMGVGRNLAYRKSVFTQNKGFGNHQSTLGGDDDLFVQQQACKTNTKVLWGKESLVYSRPHTDFIPYVRQKIRHFSVGKYYPLISLIELQLKSVFQMLLWTSFIILAIESTEKHPILVSFIGFFIVKGLFDWGVARKLGEGYLFILGPFLDLFDTVFRPILAVFATVSKRKTWK